MKRCEHCGEALGEDAAFCPACGRAVLQLPGAAAPKSSPQPERELTRTQVGMPIPQVFELPTPDEPQQSERPSVESNHPAISEPIETADSAKATLVQAEGIAALLAAESGSPSESQAVSSERAERSDSVSRMADKAVSQTELSEQPQARAMRTPHRVERRRDRLKFPF